MYPKCHESKNLNEQPDSSVSGENTEKIVCFGVEKSILLMFYLRKGQSFRRNAESPAF